MNGKEGWGGEKVEDWEKERRIKKKREERKKRNGYNLHSTFKA